MRHEKINSARGYSVREASAGTSRTKLWKVYPTRDAAQTQINEWNNSPIASWSAYRREYEICEEDGGFVIYQTLIKKE